MTNTVIPDEAREAAAPWIENFLERRGITLRGKEAETLAGYVIRAAAPHIRAQEASNEDGFWVISTSPEAINRAARKTGYTPGFVRLIIDALVDATDKDDDWNAVDQ